MGKKGVILDSGKTAQSSMSLYWKKNKDSAKHPKQKPQQENEKQITDKSVMSNFQKWKLHKQKIIIKAYTKPQPQKQVNTKQKAKQNEDQDLLLQDLLESKKPKIITIPGFKSKQELAKRLQIQKPKEADQSTNILKLPSHLQNMTHQDMVNILRQKKNHMINKSKHKKQQNKEQQHNQEENMLMDDQYIDLTRNKDKKIIQALIEQKIQEEVKQPEPTFFKSDFLNQIDKKGLYKVLQDANIKSEKQQEMALKKELQAAQILKQAAQKQQIALQQTKERFVVDKKFMPRALKK